MKPSTKEMQKSVVMKCPVCKSPELQATELEDGLTFFRCAECRGRWIRGVEYWKWLDQKGPNLPERHGEESDLSLAESGLPLDCPECRFRLIKYLVGHGFTFTIDHCKRGAQDTLAAHLHFKIRGRRLRGDRTRARLARDTTE
jgi:Zn-finger nucleic acid-binding protein